MVSCGFLLYLVQVRGLVVVLHHWSAYNALITDRQLAWPMDTPVGICKKGVAAAHVVLFVTFSEVVGCSFLERVCLRTTDSSA